MIVARTRVAAAAIGFAIAIAAPACACPSDGGEAPSVSAPPPDPPEDDAFIREAHQAALRRLTAAAQRAFVVADPIAAHRLGLAELAPTPTSRSAREPLRELIAAALKESDGIDRNLLTPEDAMLRHALATGLHALDRELRRTPALLRDPTVLATNAFALLHAIDAARTDEGCDGCAQALERLGTEVTASLGQVGASSVASASAATADLARLASRLQQLGERDPALAPAAQAAGVAVEGARSRFEAVVARLPDAEEVTWRSAVGGATTPEAVLRLPDRLGATELTRRLAEDEALELSPSALVDQITALLSKLQAMEARLSPTAPGPATAPTLQRCEDAWAPLSTWAASNPASAAAKISCTAALTRLGTDAQTDPELSLSLFAIGVLEPTRRERLDAVPPALALVSGAMAPTGQAHALQISAMIASGQDQAAGLAIERARREVCVALAGLLEHGELGDAPSRAARLARDCPAYAAETLVADALARPRPSLASASLFFLAAGPAEAVALSRFWWAPLGLVAPLADPLHAGPFAPSNLRPATVEPLTPGAP